MKMALRRGSLARAIDELARRRAQLPAAEIVTTLRQRASYPLSPPVFGPVFPFADILIHGGDIRIPLSLPFEPDPEQVGLALDFLTGRWPFGFVPLGRLWVSRCTAPTLIDPGARELKSAAPGQP
jgi:hypothetical protein